MKAETLSEKFKTFNLSENLFSTGQKLLVAVSGGIDSVVLCDLFNKSGFEFTVIHCNFQLRGTDSDEDSLFVQALAEKYNVAFYSEKFDTLKYQKDNQLSLEVAARELRYHYFEEIRKNFGYDLIATGHHLNDNIETVFFNLIKGTGIKGLTGIPLKNGKIIRPLLFATRAEIEYYAKENSILYRKDVSNENNTFDRNKIRNEIIPLMQNINSSLENTMARNIKHLKEIAIIYQEQVKKKLSSLKQIKGNDIYLSVPAILNLPAAATYLHEFLHPFKFNEDQIHSILLCLGETGKVFYSENYRVVLDRKNIILTPIEKMEQSIIIIDGITKTIPFKGYKLLLEFSNYNKQLKFNESGSITYFDADTISFPLILRTWEKGDYLYPLGLTKKKSDKPGKKKVSDILTNAKYNILQKENTKVLLCGEKIIWVLGLRQDGRFKITEKTTRLLKIKMLPE